MSKQTTIEIRKQYLHFSAAHFTIFSATSRERLHGHNFRVAAKISGPIGDNGLCFDYAIFKQKLRELCERFDEYTLIAEHSPHLDISNDEQFYHIRHNGITMPLLKSDTLLLPLRNITIEELSGYLLDILREDQSLLDELAISAIELLVSSGPEQWGISHWSALEKPTV